MSGRDNHTVAIPRIDYGLLDSSCHFYEHQGFSRIEAPWWISLEAMKVTTPPSVRDEDQYILPTNGMCLVASAEQSFIELARLGSMPRGKFFSITPCFRNEVAADEWHHNYFMKNELIDNKTVNETSLLIMVDVAYDFFRNYVPDFRRLCIVDTAEGFDLEYNRIEIGSYGIRSCKYMDWVYGTGCAEPRFSQATGRFKVD